MLEPQQSSTSNAKKHFKGCNCRKTKCLKNYCECFQAGVKCSNLCTCDNCENCEDKPTNHNNKWGGVAQNAYAENISMVKAMISKENVQGSENMRPGLEKVEHKHNVLMQ